MLVLLALTVLVLLVVLLTQRLYMLHRRLSEQRKAVQAVQKRFRELSEPLMWARWWARNATENPVAEEREALQRLALAALCADSRETLRVALQSASVAAPGALGNLYALALQELDAAVLPWVWQAQQFPGQPAHVPELVSRGVIRALTGRFVLGEGQSNSGLVAGGALKP